MGPELPLSARTFTFSLTFWFLWAWVGGDDSTGQRFLLVFTIALFYTASAVDLQPALVVYSPGAANTEAVSFLRSQTLLLVPLEITTSTEYFLKAAFEGGPAPLDRFSAVVFLNFQGSQLTASQRGALTDYIDKGNGFAAIGQSCNTQKGNSWTWYDTTLLGTACYNTSRPIASTQPATLIVADRTHPSTGHLPTRWNATSGWLNFDQNVRLTHHVLFTALEKSYTGGFMGYDHPISWCKELKASHARIWYSALGSEATDWQNAQTLQHFLGGISYAAGAVSGDCTASLDEYYEKTIIASTQKEPLQIDVAADGRVFWTDRSGALRIFNPNTTAVKIAARFDVTNDVEDGLLGFALDFNFTDTQLIFAYWSPSKVANESRLSRFKLNGDTLDLNSEMVLLKIQTQRKECCHSAGQLLADRKNGYLYLTAGDNTSPYGDSDSYAPLDERPNREYFDSQHTSANTQDLRGKILRIKPKPEGGYDIPPGNLFPNSRDGRPEIYVMGVRNPYRMAVDPITSVIYWAEVGPNAEPGPRGPRGVDEVNMAKSAGNYGWPYCIGPNEPFARWDFNTKQANGFFDCNNLQNWSPHLDKGGSHYLPPARPAMVYYGYEPSTVFPEFTFGITDPSKPGRCAFLGPFVRTNTTNYDSPGNNLQPPIQPKNLPAYFDNTVILMEWRREYLLELKLDENGELLKINPLWNSWEWRGPIDMKIGPDGAAYVVEYGTDFEGLVRDPRISKIQYSRHRQLPACSFTASPSSGQPPLDVAYTITSAPGNYSYSWDVGANVEPQTSTNPSFTYNIAGIYTTVLTIQDLSEGGGQAKCSQEIVVGNTAPVVAFSFPPKGSVYEWGDKIPFIITVTDAEDGSTEDPSKLIDCSKVSVQPGLGHDNHVHTMVTQQQCKGEFVTLASGHEGDLNLYYVLNGRYLDAGGAAGVGPLDSEDVVVLQPKRKEAETQTNSSADLDSEDTTDTDGFQDIIGIADGAYLCYNRYNLWNILSLTLRLKTSTPITITARYNSPDGPVVAKIEVGATSSFVSATAPIAPGVWSDTLTTTQLCFVFQVPTAGEVSFNWFRLDGPGATSMVNVTPPKTPVSGGGGTPSSPNQNSPPQASEACRSLLDAGLVFGALLLSLVF